MPETGRILQFPQQVRRKILSSAEAGLVANRYLGASESERSEELRLVALNDPDVVLAILAQLRGMADGSPSLVASEARDVYRVLADKQSLGFFDERDYFLGESALIAGSALRLLGRRDEAELWLDRAEASFRHVVNPGPALANVSYARLTLHYDCGRYDRALSLLPSLALSFEKLSMRREALKCRFLEAMCLKNSSRTTEALRKLELLVSDPALASESGLLGLVLLNLGDLATYEGRRREALPLYQRALPLLQSSNQAFAVAHLKGLIGEALRADGRVAAAVESFRAAIADYAALGMVTWVAYLRLVLSESLIALSRNREAEWEILAALPTIEAEKMLPEGFAAVTLLRESVRRRQTDGNALREIRQQVKVSH